MRRIVCPYHGWTYDTDGTLLKRPAAVGRRLRRRHATCDLHLIRLRSPSSYGMIFVRPDEHEPIDVDDLLSGAQDELADFGLGRLRARRDRASTRGR